MADAPPKTQTNSASQISSDHANPSNFFLYKAALVTAFLVLLPLFPSLAPDFMNQSLHARSWELLQLIFVGIAVSYGLFSKKNEESHKDNPISKMDNAQSYVSKLLQVSSVFDDDSDTHTVIEDSSKFQALNSQYYRGQPVVVVAKESPAVEETNGVVSQINQKPLLLPVRSLKQRVPNEVEKESNDYETKFVDKRGTVQSYTAEEEEEEEAVVETVEEEDRFEESSSGNVGGAADVGPDVDKKADEFIAKFREQIRLQRIESIRRSTAQRAGKPLR